jgi:clan AA aspartic protease
MGLTDVSLVVSNPSNPSKVHEGRFLVDSGAMYTVVPARVVKELGLTPEFEQSFELADRSVIKRMIGSAVVGYGDRKIAVPVILGEKNDDAMMGATTLESLGLALNPLERKIYFAKLLPL